MEVVIMYMWISRISIHIKDCPEFA